MGLEKVGAGEVSSSVDLQANVSQQLLGDIINSHVRDTGTASDGIKDDSNSQEFFCSADSSDVGHWDHGDPTHAGPARSRWVASESENNGFAAAQILKKPNATDAEREHAANLILNSPNPEHAVWTANNGVPTQYGFFRNTYSDSLYKNGLSLKLEYTEVRVPPQGRPTDAGYRPGYTTNVPSGLVLGPR